MSLSGEKSRSREVRRAVTTLIVFAAVYAVLHAATFFLAPHYRLHRETFFGQRLTCMRSRLANESVEPLPLAIMLGSSRVADGFDGRTVEQVFQSETGRHGVVYNFGVPGSGPIAQLLFGKRLLDEGVRPRLMLLEIMPTMLLRVGNSLPAEADWFVPNRVRANEIDLIAHYGLSRERLEEYHHEARLNPWSVLRGPLLSRTIPQLLPANERQWFLPVRDASGRMPTYTPQINSEQRAKLRRDIFTSLQGALKSGEINPHCATALRDLLHLCRDRDVPTLLVLMPEGSSFRQLYTPEVETRLQAHLRQLKGEYAVNCIDARQWVLDDDFVDDVHLLASGAEIFSNRLARDVLIPRFDPSQARRVSR